jgi:1-acyl-sn-glycerol-3-phosphate acyltransferase
MELSGQTYVDMYAASVKERAAKAKSDASHAGEDEGRASSRVPGTRAS